MNMTPADIDAICGLVDDLCGIYLDERKTYLIESRLKDLVERNNCANYVEFARKVRQASSGQLRNHVVDAITTNETLFFRDSSLFEALTHKVIPELIDSKERARSRQLRVWSAACSTGQEVYSVAMLFAELLGNDIHRWNLQILGTDISDDAVSRSSRGWYAPHEIQRGMSQQRLNNFFHAEDDGWRVNDELRSLAAFSKQNLLDPLGTRQRFDIVLCRNVAIYFKGPARRDLFERITAATTPEGYLFVGGQESLADLGPQFKPQHHCRAAVYRPNMISANAAGQS